MARQREPSGLQLRLIFATLMANLISCLPWSPISVTLCDLSVSQPQCDQARDKAICSARPVWFPSDSGFTVTHLGSIQLYFITVWRQDVWLKVTSNTTSALILDQVLLTVFKSIISFIPPMTHRRKSQVPLGYTYVGKLRPRENKSQDCCIRELGSHSCGVHLSLCFYHSCFEKYRCVTNGSGYL